MKGAGGLAPTHHHERRGIYITIKDLLYAAEHGIIDVGKAQHRVKTMMQEEWLRQHPYKVWQGGDGLWRTYLPGDSGGTRGRRMVKRSERIDVERAIIDYWQKYHEDPTFGEVFTEWNDRRYNLGKIAKGTYDRNVYIYKRSLEGLADRPIGEITENELCTYLEERPAHDKLTVRGFANLKTVVRGVFHRAKKRGLTDIDVESALYDLDVSSRELVHPHHEDAEEIFDDRELGMMMRFLYDHPDPQNNGIALMFASGIRVGELCALKYGDIDDFTLTIRRTESHVYTPDGKPLYIIKESPKTEAGFRRVAIPRQFAWLMDRLKGDDPDQWVFRDDTGKRMTTNAFRMRQKRVCRWLGITVKTPHKARRTYASILLDNGVDRNLILSQMGHTDILTTERYYHRNRKSMDRKIDILSNIPEFSMITSGDKGSEKLA